jgi:MerR family copper efflux transcriptional regulator
MVAQPAKELRPGLGHACVAPRARVFYATKWGSEMTIGELSRRTGISVKTLREYEGMGLIYTVGRSPGNYRLFDESALWCVGVIRNLRSLGLTLAEIREIAAIYLGKPDEPIGPHVSSRVRAARSRITARIEELEQLRRRIDEFETSNAGRLAGDKNPGLGATDPRPRNKRA